ncbi:MAG: endonuclease NucS [Methanobacteriaceae archaeon]|jgi:RecB family endonuclease NucS|nr:endonuclease NucS [Methanobacteriaceae archaeon]
MEEWVAEYPQILGEDPLTITTEYDKFDKTSNRLDVLAIDKNGKIVVIELKRDIANIFMDLQAIHYAAYCSTLNLEQVVEMMSEYHGKSRMK